MMSQRPITRLTVVAGLAAMATACATPPVTPPSLGMGSVVDVRALDIIGSLTMHRGSGGSDPLEGMAAEKTVCPCAAVEYVVRLDSGTTEIVAQELLPSEQPFSPGARVSVQNRDGERKILPAPGV